MYVYVPILFLPMIFRQSLNLLYILTVYSNYCIPYFPYYLFFFNFSYKVIWNFGSISANPKSIIIPLFVSGSYKKFPGLISL